MAQDSRGVVGITNLKPYTTYKVTIALITKHGEGLHSDPLLNTTLEGGLCFELLSGRFNAFTIIINCISFSAPDINDLKMNVTGLTNTSVTLQWLPPKFTNGIVRYYHVHYFVDRTSPQLHQQELIDELVDEQQTERHITVHEPKVNIEYKLSFDVDIVKILLTIDYNLKLYLLFSVV